MSTDVALGMPTLPAPVLAPRRPSRKIVLKHPTHPVEVGGGAPISVQSMTTTLTSDVNATLQQIAELTAAGCQVVRVAVPSQDDADALPAIAKKSGIPVIADIHFQPRYVFAAIDAGCAGVRVNPGNIKTFDDRVKEIAKAAGDAGTPIRIGVNAGSLDRRLLAKYGKATPEALVESALWECSLFEEHGFRDIKISVKHHDPVVMVTAYRLLAQQCDYPLHLGVTEAGPPFQGTIKSAVAFGALLAEGIGDTIRVSLSAPPVEEVKVGLQMKRRFWEEDESIFGGVSYTNLPITQISYPSTGFNKGGKGVLLGCYTWNGPNSYEFTAMTPQQRVQKAVEYGAQIHPQYKEEFETGVSWAWHRSPFTLGCAGDWTDEARKEHYNNLCQIDGRIVLAGEHASYIPAWQEGAILSSLNAIERLHQRVMQG